MPHFLKLSGFGFPAPRKARFSSAVSLPSHTIVLAWNSTEIIASRIYALGSSYISAEAGAPVRTKREAPVSSGSRGNSVYKSDYSKFAYRMAVAQLA